MKKRNWFKAWVTAVSHDRRYEDYLATFDEACLDRLAKASRLELPESATKADKCKILARWKKGLKAR